MDCPYIFRHVPCLILLIIAVSECSPASNRPVVGGQWCHYTKSVAGNHPVPRKQRPARSLGPFPIADIGSKWGGVDVDEDEDEGVSGEYADNTEIDVEVDSEGRQITQCKAKDACYVIWREENVENSTISIDHRMIGGCLPIGYMKYDLHKCGNGVCQHEGPPRSNHTFFCCCFGDYCNERLHNSWIEPPTTPWSISMQEPIRFYEEKSFWVSVVVGVIVLFGVAGIVWYVIRAQRKIRMLKLRHEEEKKKRELGDNVKALLDSANDGDFDMSSVQLGTEIAKGRYGVVHVANANGGKVAVKFFTEKHRAFFLHEWHAYKRPFMGEHANILQYLAADEKPECIGGVAYLYWLVVEYHDNKSLIDYLKNNTIDAATLGKMSVSLASGLAFLHSELNRDGRTKPAMVHRDLNSRNILVKSDLSVCICDMGFALCLKTTSSDRNGNSTSLSADSDNDTGISVTVSTKSDEAPVLNDVGTIRYMAPEVLEGSLNLRDSSTALRQVDMYAFGLVLWEMASRCTDLYQGLPVPDYQLPFQKEAGVRPTFAQMQNLVARRKARPLFPEIWKDTNLAVRFLKDAMDECWDGDADARLSANCVMERLMEWSVMWEKCPLLNNLEGNSLLLTSRPEELIQMQDLLSNDTDLSDVRLPPIKNVNAVWEQMNGPPAVSSRMVQPHQGRNPCQERNIKPESSEELTSSGNNLVGRDSGLNSYDSATGFAPNRVADSNMESRVGNGQVEAPSVPVTPGNILKKKVPNSVAAQQNRENPSSWLSMFRKKPTTTTSLMAYRAVAANSPSGASQPLLSVTGSASLPSTSVTSEESKCNLRTAGLLSQMLSRGDQPDSSNASHLTQLTCLSPSPSTSGTSPPRAIGHSRIPRFSLIRDGVETDTEEEERLN